MELSWPPSWFPRVVQLCLIAGALVQVCAAFAEPCTLYKAEDVAKARENVKRYTWAQAIVNGWKGSVDYAMQQDREFFEEMIPELTAWNYFGQNCPACVGKQSSMGECGLYRWNVEDPDKLVCKYCGTVYPNEDYPETGSMTCPKMGQTFTYYETPEERAHPDENPAKYALKWVGWPIHTSWTGLIRQKKGHYCASKVFPLAKLYAVTGEVKYAERCAWILDTLAKRYPNWLFHSYNGTYADCPPAEAAANMGEYGGGGKFPKEVIIDPFNRHQKKDYATLCNGFWGSGRFDTSGCHSFHLHWTVAYDLIRDAKREDGTPVLSEEMDKRIVNDLLLAACDDMENWKDINNKCGPGRALSAAAGILFERPDSARRALDGFETLMSKCFHVDGFCKESPSYSSMHLGLMRNIPEILRGYSDPEGYQPEEGERFGSLNPFEHVVRYRLALESMVRMLAPHGRYPCLGDTSHGAGLSPDYVEILADRYSHDYAGLLEKVQKAKLADRGSEYALWYRDPDMKADAEARLPLHSEWFPGWHVAVMRGPDPDGDSALYLNAYMYYGHRHHDTLGILYYAFGKELASDRGYIWDDPRNAWTAGTLSHNLVTVDGANQQRKERHSTLELFGTAPGIQVTQASANAYDQCDRYQRTCAFIQLPGKQTYAVDFFRVSGGKLHQYGFQCNGEMIDLSGPTPQPTNEEHKWLSNLRACEPEEPFSATWQYKGANMELTVLNPIDRLLIADAPGWRSDQGSELNAPPIQQVFAERTAAAAGTDTVTSDYVAIMAPYDSENESPILSARLLEVEDSGGALVVEVKLADRTDYIISALDGEQREYGPVTMAGQFGFVSLGPGETILQAYLLDGTELSCGATQVTLPQASVALKVDSVAGRSFHLAEAVPADLAADSKAYLLAGTTGYEVESAAGKTIRVRDYPAIECDEVRLLNSVWLQFMD